MQHDSSAFPLILAADPALLSIVGLSLVVSLAAVALATVIGLPIGAAVACFFGVILGAPTLKLRGDYLAIVTLGFGEIVRIFLNNLSQPVNLTNGPQGITLIDPFRIADFSFAKTEMIMGLYFSGPLKY